MAEFIPDEYPWPAGLVAPGVFAVRAYNANALTHTGTNSFILWDSAAREKGQGEGAQAPVAGAKQQQGLGAFVVDPGPLGQHLQDLLEAANEQGVRIAAVLLTHNHTDHSEGADEFAAMVGGVPVLSVERGTLASGPLAPQLPDTAADSSLPAIEVVPLPGHSSDSMGFLLRKQGLLLTGDVIFRHGPTGVFYPSGVLSDYLATLDALEELARSGAARVLLSAHGWPIDDPIQIIQASREHRLQRLAQIDEAIAQGVPPNTEAVLDHVYAAIKPQLRRPARRSVQAQLLYRGYDPEA